MRKKLAVKKEY